MDLNSKDSSLTTVGLPLCTAYTRKSLQAGYSEKVFRQVIGLPLCGAYQGGCAGRL